MKKLTKEQWKEIDKLLESPNRVISQIATQFNVSRVSIYDRVNQKKGFWRRLFNIFLQEVHTLN